MRHAGGKPDKQKEIIMMTVEVVDIRKANGDGKLKAMASVKFGDSLIVRGFFVMDGIKGLFIKGPQKISKDGRWLDTCSFDEFLKQEIEDKVLEAYEKESNAD